MLISKDTLMLALFWFILALELTTGTAVLLRACHVIKCSWWTVLVPATIILMLDAYADFG
jgi:hypothetical protein